MAPLAANTGTGYEIAHIELTTMITMDDGTKWVLIDDHWVGVDYSIHADWCCDIRDL